MNENNAIQNLRARRNGFIAGGLKRTKLGEEEKGTTNNQFIASLIMNTNLEFFKNESKENTADFMRSPLSPKVAVSPISIKPHEDTSQLFSPRSDDTTYGIQNKFKAYMSGASIIKSKQADLSEINNSTLSGNCNNSNSMLMSPSSHSKPNLSYAKSPGGNSLADNVSNRKYVANVIERDLFRNTFMNIKQDYKSNGIKEEPEESEPPVYRKRNL